MIPRTTSHVANETFSIHNRMIARYRKWLSMSEVGDSSGAEKVEPKLQTGSGESQRGILSRLLSLCWSVFGYIWGKIVYNGISPPVSQDSQLESEIPNAEVTMSGQPGFSLFPVSKGFAISLKKTLNKFELLCNTPATPSTSNTALGHPPPVFPQIPPTTSTN